MDFSFPEELQQTNVEKRLSIDHNDFNQVAEPLPKGAFPWDTLILATSISISISAFIFWVMNTLGMYH